MKALVVAGAVAAGAVAAYATYKHFIKPKASDGNDNDIITDIDERIKNLREQVYEECLSREAGNFHPNTRSKFFATKMSEMQQLLKVVKTKWQRDAIVRIMRYYWNFNEGYPYVKNSPIDSTIIDTQIILQNWRHNGSVTTPVDLSALGLKELPSFHDTCTTVKCEYNELTYIPPLPHCWWLWCLNNEYLHISHMMAARYSLALTRDYNSDALKIQRMFRQFKKKKRFVKTLSDLNVLCTDVVGVCAKYIS